MAEATDMIFTGAMVREPWEREGAPAPRPETPVASVAGAPVALSTRRRLLGAAPPVCDACREVGEADCPVCRARRMAHLEIDIDALAAARMLPYVIDAANLVAR